MGLRLSAVWVAMVAFDGPVPLATPFEGAFVDGDKTLTWAANNTAKLGAVQAQSSSLSSSSPSSGGAGGGGGGLQCWTLISTNAYGQANKVPQVRTM